LDYNQLYIYIKGSEFTHGPAAVTAFLLHLKLKQHSVQPSLY